jgi:hypothetical protein
MINSILSFLEYLFSFSPTREFNLQWVIWALIIVTAITAIGIFLVNKKSSDKIFHKLFKEYPGKLLTLDFLLLINLLSRINRVELLSMRFLTYTLSAWILFSFYEMYFDWSKKLPSLKSSAHQKQISQVKKYHIHHNKKRKTRS